MKHLIVMLTLLLGSAIATAAGSYYSVDEELESASKMIYKQKYKQAIEILQQAIDSEPDNADAWNLLGYALRKEGNLEKSAEAYSKALSIDPDHKDALEYQGELYLMLKDNAAAQSNLDKLSSLCPEGCEQLEMLSKAIAERE